MIKSEIHDTFISYLYEVRGLLELDLSPKEIAFVLQMYIAPRNTEHCVKELEKAKKKA
ncbi:hypothetical protein D3C78_1351850 [compost metagenome]